MSRVSELQKWMSQYKYEKDSAEFELAPFVDWLIAKGVKLPTPPTAREMMAKEVSRAAREEKRHDEDGEYRANLAVHIGTGDQRQVVWVDIDKASRLRMEMNSTQRREQIVGDVVGLVRDVAHWNKRNPDQQPLQIEMDFGFDVDLARATRDLAKAG